MEDNEIIKICKRGEKEAFQVLISRYHPFVYKYLYRISENDLIVDDLVQETFIKMIKGIDKFDLQGKAKFSTYLITIAKNCYIDYYRREKKRMSEVSIDELSNIEASGTNVQELIVAKLYNESVLEYLENLTEDQRIAIKLKYIEDLTLKEIGEILNIEPKTIKSRIHNGIVKLRSMIERGDYDERD
jgi:RNA polymerase sigma-70 factor (ECF subfamily)